MFRLQETTLTVQKFEHYNRGKMLAGTVENSIGAVWTPLPSKLLYGKGAVAWMCGNSAEKRHFGLLK